MVWEWENWPKKNEALLGGNGHGDSRRKETHYGMQSLEVNKGWKEVAGIPILFFKVQTIILGKTFIAWNQFFYCLYSFMVGNGKRGRFWEERWVRERPFFLSIPHLYRLSENHNFPIVRMCVNSCVLPVSWDFGF